MGTYDSQIALALRLIAAKGKPLTLKHGVAVQNRLTNQVTGTGQTSYTVKGVVLPDETKGETPQHSRRKVLVAGASCPVDPIPGDTLGLVEGRTWKVTNAKALRPDDGPTILLTIFIER